MSTSPKIYITMPSERKPFGNEKKLDILSKILYNYRWKLSSFECSIVHSFGAHRHKGQTWITGAHRR